MTATEKQETRQAVVTRRWPGFALIPFLYLLIFFVLPPPLPVQVEGHLLEPSWRIVLTDAFLRGAQFGTDVIHTYGPWGFVANPQGDPRIYPWLVGARLLIATAFVFGVSIITIQNIRGLVRRTLFLAWIVVFADPIYVAPAVLLALVAVLPRQSDRICRITVHLLACACALTMWIKFTSFITVAALAAVLALQDLFKRRRPLISVEITTAAFAFWVIARQSPLGLPAFLRGALSTAASFSGAMLIGGPYPEIPLIVLLLLAVAIPSALFLYRSRRWSLWPSLLWIALLFFLQLKEAFVRNDSLHIWMGLVNALLPCALILTCAAGYFDPPAGRLVTRFCAGAIVLVSIVLTLLEIPGVAGFERFELLTRNIDSLKAFFSGRSLSDDYRRHLADFRRARPLRHVSGTAAVFPDDQALLFGNGIEPCLPPVPQAFEAYNAYLTAENAAFYRGVRRPDYVFFDVRPIDSRYPAITDPLTWLALLDCYVPDGNSGTYLVLRSAPCRNSSLELISQSTARVGEAITIPDGNGPVWAEINVRLNTMGSIVAMLARPPSTLLSVETAAGRNVYNLTAEVARTGFLLSPEILTPDAFAQLLSSDHLAGAFVRNIAIVQSGLGQRMYRPSIFFRFYRIHFAPR